MPFDIISPARPRSAARSLARPQPHSADAGARGKSPALISPTPTDGVAGRAAHRKLLNAGRLYCADTCSFHSRVESWPRHSRPRGVVVSIVRDNPITAARQRRSLRRLVALIDDAVQKGARAVALEPASRDPSRSQARADDSGRRERQQAVLKEEIFGPVCRSKLHSLDQADREDQRAAAAGSLYMSGGDAAAAGRCSTGPTAAAEHRRHAWHFSTKICVRRDRRIGNRAYHGGADFSLTHQKAVFVQTRSSFTWLCARRTEALRASPRAAGKKIA